MEHAFSNLINTPLLLFILIVFPFLAALCVHLTRSSHLQSFIVTASSAVLTAGALLLVPQAPFDFSLPSVFGIDLHAVVNAADFLLLFVILYFGFKHRHFVIKILAVLQIISLAFLDFFITKGKHPADTFYGDNFALIVALIVSVAIAGSVLRFHSIPYVQAFGEHFKFRQSDRGRCFALMLLSLGAINGVVLSNDMSFFYFFFELITLCSFLLMVQKGTPTAVKKAVRTLSMTSLAGLVFLLAMI